MQYEIVHLHPYLQGRQGAKRERNQTAIYMRLHHGIPSKR